MQARSIWDLGGARGSLRQAIVVPLGIGAAFLAFGSIPEIFSRNFQFSDYLHGGVPILALIATSVFPTFMMTLREMQLRSAAGKPPKIAFVRNYSFLYLFGILWICISTYQDHALPADLEKRGRMTQAILISTFTEMCSKHGCSTGVEYVYRLPGSKALNKGVASEGNISRNHSSEYAYILSTHSVPIKYDPLRPEHSMVDWQGSINRQASWGYAAFSMVLLILFVTVPTSVATFIAWAAMKDFDTKYRSANNIIQDSGNA